MYNSYAHNKRFVLNNFIYCLVVVVLIFTILFSSFAFFIKMNNFRFGYAVAEVNENETENNLKNKTDELLNDIDFSELENFLENEELGFDLFNGLSFKDYVSSIIKSEEEIDLNSILSLVTTTIKKNIKNILYPLLIVLIVALLCNMFVSFKSGKINGVGEIIYLICFSVIVIIITKMSSSIVADAKYSIKSINNQMGAIFPILLSLITSMGGVVSVKAYTPMLAFLTGTISNIFVYVLMPLFSLSLILTIIGHLSDNTKLNKLNSFIHSLFKWVVGVVFAIFMFFLSVKGITAGASDGLSIKATKYAIKNYIPLLGGYISEGFELVKAGSLLIKNATGFVGILLLFSIIVKPILTVGVLQLGLKLLAGVLEPIGDNKTSNLLYGIAKSFKLLVVVLVGVSLMYFLSIFLLTCSASNFI